MRAVICSLSALALAGCGGGGPSDAVNIRSTLATFATATAHKDFRTLCTRVFAPKLVQSVAGVGLSCEAALAQGLGAVSRPSLTVQSVKQRGTKAFARVHSAAINQQSSDDMIELTKVGDRWYVSALVTRGRAPLP